MTLKIGLITTLHTNIGDDFIRDGILRILRAVYKGQQLEFVSVNKHDPFSVYPGWHPAHIAYRKYPLPVGHAAAQRFADYFLSTFGLSRFDGCDLIVQCGAPVFWPNCYVNEWAQPLWYQVIGRLHEIKPVINIAAGSCYPWENQPISIPTPEDETYLKDILRFCRLTTVRDRLSQILCTSLGTEVPLIPCAAFLAAEDQTSELSDNGLVAINYMHSAGHYDWNQNIDHESWLHTIRDLISRLQKRHKLVFVCHNEQEYKLAGDMEPDIPRLFPKSPKEYFAVAKNIKGAICNRMHASVGLAGMGIPSIAIGTDTRMLMIKELGLPSWYARDVGPAQLEEAFESLLSKRKREQERLMILRFGSRTKYIELISKAV